jgi:2-aminoethylphosphonate-pyruvate transaminase
MTAPLLLNPGPVTLTARVRGALQRADLCHREIEYADLQREVQSALLAVYGKPAGYLALLLAGSGTAAVEAMVGTFVPRGGHALVLANGVYGDRMAAMLKAQGKAHTVLTSPWTEAFDLAAVDSALDANPAVTHILAVHHETTTGRLNPVAELGALCARRGVKLLLDAVSSFGAEAIAFAEWNLEALAATANKCLHGAPGTAFVIAREAAFDERPSGATSVYLDLHRYRAGAATGEPPFTPAVPSLYALDEALKEHAELGGWTARRDTYRTRGERVRLGLAALGIADFLADPAAYGAALTAYAMPEAPGYDVLHDRLKAAGFVIYAGQGGFAGRIFRIATMGDLTLADMDRLLEAIACVLTEAREAALSAS